MERSTSDGAQRKDHGALWQAGTGPNGGPGDAAGEPIERAGSPHEHDAPGGPTGELPPKGSLDTSHAPVPLGQSARVPPRCAAGALLEGRGRNDEHDDPVGEPEAPGGEPIEDVTNYGIGNGPERRLELGKAEAVQGRAERPGIEKNAAPVRDAPHGLPAPPTFLGEESSFDARQFRRIRESEGRPGSESVERLEDGHPVSRRGELADERRLPGGRGPFQGDDPPPVPPPHSGRTADGVMTAAVGDVFLARSVERTVEGPEARAVRTFLAKHRIRVLQVDDLAEVARELERTDSDPEGVGLIARKGLVRLVRLDDVSLKAAPLLKQELLAVGGDAAQARGIADHSVDRSVVVLAANPGQYQRLVPKLERQPFHLGDLGRAVELAIMNFSRRSPRTVRGAHRSLTLGDRPRTMGVLNVTPDSFSDGGAYLDPAAAVARAGVLVAEGADVLDIGAESTRPGAAELSPDAEWERLAPVLARLHGTLEVPISVDTRHAEVARRAIDAGADWVNDVSGLRDPEMRRVVAGSGAAVVVMHMRGEPGTMQSDTSYADVRDEVYGALAEATETAVEDGVPPERILVDPGIGFGKSGAQSLELLEHVGEFRSLGYPVVVGPSRKSFLGPATGNAPAHDRLGASVAAAVIAAVRGAELVRVHDVRETVQALAVVEASRRAGRRPPAEPGE